MAQRYFGTADDTTRGTRQVVRTYTAVTNDADGNPTVPVLASEFTAWFKDSALSVPVVPTSDSKGIVPAAYCADNAPTLYGGTGFADGRPPTYVAVLERRDNAFGTPVQSFQGRTGAVALTKADVTGTGLAKGDVGLGNVDNTADSGKPVSTAQATAISAAQAAAIAGAPVQSVAGLTGNPTAAQLEGAGLLRSSTASATYAPIAAPRLGCKTVWLGDSITNYSGGLVSSSGVLSQGQTDSKGIHAWANILLGHAMDAVNAGKAGDTTAQILARFTSDVAAYSPAVVVVLGGTNDALQTVPAATTQANLTAIYSAALALGAQVVACTIPPNSNATAGQTQVILTNNAWIRAYARATRGVLLADIGAAIADPATTYQPLASHLADGTHPNSLGASKMARPLADVLDRVLPPANEFLGQSNGDPTNLLTNPMFNGSGTALPTGWSVSGGLGTSSVDYAASTDGVAAPWLRVVIPYGGATLNLQQNVSLGASLAVGDKVQFGFEIEVDDLDPAPAANTQAVRAVLQAYDGSSFTSKTFDVYWDSAYVNVPFPGTGGSLLTEPLTVPSGSALVQPVIQISGGGTYRVRRSALRKV